MNLFPHSYAKGLRSSGAQPGTGEQCRATMLLASKLCPIPGAVIIISKRQEAEGFPIAPIGTQVCTFLNWLGGWAAEFWYPARQTRGCRELDLGNQTWKNEAWTCVRGSEAGRDAGARPAKPVWTKSRSRHPTDRAGGVTDVSSAPQDHEGVACLPKEPHSWERWQVPPSPRYCLCFNYLKGEICHFILLKNIKFIKPWIDNNSSMSFHLKRYEILRSGCYILPEATAVWISCYPSAMCFPGCVWVCSFRLAFHKRWHVTPSMLYFGHLTTCLGDLATHRDPPHSLSELYPPPLWG